MKPQLMTAAALVAALHCGATALAQTSGDQKRVWHENFDYRVEINGVVSPQARLFSAGGRASMLLTAPELNQPVALQVNGREVLMVDPASIEAGPVPEQIALSDSGIHGPPVPYTMDGDAVIFFLDGRKVRLSRKPPLVGAATMEDLMSQLPGYRKGMEAYAPSDSDAFYLKNYKYPVRIEVFFGSWCPHCRETVPQFLKSMSVAANENIKVSFVGVPPPPFKEYPPAREKGIDGVPTFIVYAEEKEIGRVSTIPGGSSVEHELVKVLFQYQQSKS